ncbi:MAG: hypothetical protein LBK91_04825 [Synergistaceae bacterium]|nr:hypothetical protein [Synergistaceae bacterium]
MNFGLECNMPKRTYAAVVAFMLLSLGICLAYTARRGLSDDMMRGEDIYTYERTMAVINGTASMNEINEPRTRVRAIFAFQMQCADVQPGHLFSTYISDTHAHDPTSRLSYWRELLLHGADMVARK